MSGSAALSRMQLAWRIRRALAGLRWPGLLGLILLAAAIALALGVSGPMLDRLRALEDEARVLGTRTGAAGISAQARAPRSQLGDFLAFFPPASSLSDMLARVQRAARDNGLTLPRGEYRLVREPGFSLARYQMVYPVQGSYAQVRGFVNDVLDTVPAAALEEMALERENVADTTLEARVRFTLFLGERP